MYFVMEEVHEDKRNLKRKKDKNVYSPAQIEKSNLCRVFILEKCKVNLT